LLGFILAAGVLAAVRLVKRQPLVLPGSLLRWLLVFIPAGIVAAFQGGVLSGVAEGWLSGLLPGAGGAAAYHTFSFSLVWPPQIISGHLGYLSLFNPSQLFVAFLETGPIILILPLVIILGFKAARWGRWYETAVIAAGTASLAFLFVQYSGTAGPTALTRVQGLFTGICAQFAVPVLWLWGRGRTETLKIWVGLLLLVTLLGGIVLFGIQLIAAPRPVYSNFLNDLDAHASRDYWNRLENGALIFDPLPYRVPVVFGRATKSSTNQYTETPEWNSLHADPSPQALHAFGFDYAYLDLQYWDSLKNDQQARIEKSTCMSLVREYTQVFPKDFRRLYDLRSCP
jgi:hypothetical protein